MEKKNSLGTICFLSAFVIILHLGAMDIIGCFLWGVVAFARQKQWGGVALFGLFVVFAIVAITMQFVKEHGFRNYFKSLRHAIIYDSPSDRSE